MIEPVQVFWAPAGESMPSLGSRALVDVTDGDTPNLRMPVRMLSVDTPDVTARSGQRASEIDQEFAQLAQWIRQGKAPIDPGLAEFLLPRLETGRAGNLHFEQGQAASAFGKQNIDIRLPRPGGKPRAIFIRTADSRSTTAIGCWPTSPPTTARRNGGRSLSSSGRRSTSTSSLRARPHRS